jgi:hypothetical protein
MIAQARKLVKAARRVRLVSRSADDVLGGPPGRGLFPFHNSHYMSVVQVQKRGLRMRCSMHMQTRMHWLVSC